MTPPGGMAALKGLQLDGVGGESYPGLSALHTHALHMLVPRCNLTSAPPPSSHLPFPPSPSSLQVLDLSHNQLQELPCWLPLLSRLTAVHLQHNQLDSSCQEVLQVGGRGEGGDGGEGGKRLTT